MESKILDKVRFDRWYAVEDEELGGWVVSNSPHVFTDPIIGRWMILAHVSDEFVARHIAEAHNATAAQPPSFMLDSFFGDGDMKEVYVVICDDALCEERVHHFDDRDQADAYHKKVVRQKTGSYKCKPQMYVRYVWTSNLREVV